MWICLPASCTRTYAGINKRTSLGAQQAERRQGGEPKGQHDWATLGRVAELPRESGQQRGCILLGRRALVLGCRPWSGFAGLFTPYTRRLEMYGREVHAEQCDAEERERQGGMLGKQDCCALPIFL